MINGTVNDQLEPIISLTLVNEAGRSRHVQAVVDTGFTGFLTLPLEVVHDLEFAWNAYELGTLADGSEAMFETFLASLEWEGSIRTVIAAASNATPLAGMDLFRGHELRVSAVPGGTVQIAPIQ